VSESSRRWLSGVGLRNRGNQHKIANSEVQNIEFHKIEDIFNKKKKFVMLD